MKTPENYNEMIKIFGDIRPYVFEDGSLRSSFWEPTILSHVLLPFEMRLSWNNQTITRFRCHHLLANKFLEVFQWIKTEKLEEQCKYFSGCYMFRSQVGSKKLSTHCWGISVDINPDTNQLGTEGNMDKHIIEIFESIGFVWGGTFTRKDPMHFQFCKRY